MRRITSHFSANRLFHPSSSASDSRIWEAIASCSSGGGATTFSIAFPSNEDMLRCYQRTPPVGRHISPACPHNQLILRETQAQEPAAMLDVTPHSDIGAGPGEGQHRN